MEATAYDMAYVGSKIAVALVDQEMTQADLAQVVGVTPSTVSQWVSGEKRISLDNAIKVSNALGWPLDELLGRR